jgi:hypothetical protein
MKNLKNAAEIVNFKYKNRIFEVDPEKLNTVLEQLNFSKPPSMNSVEFRKYLKEHHLLIEEFLLFVSHK